MLKVAYEKLYESSNKYICIGEYYNPTPVSINYRGHSDKLFKRDFAGEFMDKYPDVELIDYGFSYRRDPLFPQDDITWFLFRK
jgi:spore coat polysaccharide biosynthesis protein SpsF